MHIYKIQKYNYNYNQLRSTTTTIYFPSLLITAKPKVLVSAFKEMAGNWLAGAETET